MTLPSDAVLRDRPIITVKITHSNFSEVLKWVQDSSGYKQHAHESLSARRYINISDTYLAGVGDYVVYDVIGSKFTTLRADVIKDLSRLQVKDWTIE